MSIYTDFVVAAVAILGGLIALAVGIGPWDRAYQLRSIARVADRFGMRAARVVWLLIALASLVAGIAIAGGIRPSYSQPDESPAEITR